MSERKIILTPEVAAKKLLRMAYEIVEQNADEPAIILAGIKENGLVIAGLLHEMLSKIFKGKIELVGLSLDKKNPSTVELGCEIEINGKVVIIADDVASSGRTLLYALKPFLVKHPKKIQALVLVERMHKAFPVNPDYVGLSVGTTLQEHITVTVEDGKVSGAFLE